MNKEEKNQIIDVLTKKIKIKEKYEELKKKEEIFKKVEYIKEDYYNLINIVDKFDISINKPYNREYYNILNYLDDCSNNNLINNLLINELKKVVRQNKRTQLINIIKYYKYK